MSFAPRRGLDTLRTSMQVLDRDHRARSAQDGKVWVIAHQACVGFATPRRLVLLLKRMRVVVWMRQSCTAGIKPGRRERLEAVEDSSPGTGSPALF